MEKLFYTTVLISFFLFTRSSFGQISVDNQLIAVGQGNLVLPELGQDCLNGSSCEGCDSWRMYVYGYSCDDLSSCYQVSSLSNSSDIEYSSFVFQNPTTAGTYNYGIKRVLMESDGTTCEIDEGNPYDYGSFTVTVMDWQWDDPLASSYCENDNNSYDLNTLISYQYGVTYSGPGVVGDTWSVAEAGVGNHTILASKSFSNGTKSIAMEVTVHPLPSVDFSDPPVYCKSGTNPDLMNFVTPIGGSFSHSYGNSLDLYGTGNENIDLANSTPGTYSITYTYIDGNGCTNSVVNEVTIDPTFSIDAGANQEACVGSGDVTLVAATSNVTWSCIDCDYVTANVFTTDDAPPGTYTVRASKTIGACSDTDDKIFTVKDLPIVEAGPDLRKCIDDGSFALTGESPTGGVWTASCSGCLGGNIFDPAAAGSGEHTVTYTYSNAEGCIASDSRKVIVVGLPNASSISVSGDERCGAGTVSLEATLSNHTIKWYAAASDGAPLHTGDTYNPDIAVGTKAFYVEAINNDGCVSPTRKSVSATAFQIPDNPLASDQRRCGPGIVNLDASGGISGATYYWYENPNGGTALDNGPSFPTPYLENSRTYYISAESPDGCVSKVRTEVQAIIDVIPGNPTVFDGENCGPGEIALIAGGAPSGGSYAWYEQETGGSSFNDTNSWQTPTVDVTTSYWISLISDQGCEGPRMEIRAIIHNEPVKPDPINAERCGPGEVQISASAGESGTFSWYETQYSSTVIKTGKDFITPSLTETRSYWVSITDDNGCESSRSEVIATINPVPDPPEVMSVERCGAGQVSIIASGGIEGASYEWFENPSGGGSIHSGETFEPEVSVTRNYYVEAISLVGCISPTRTAVTVSINSFPGKPITYDGSTCGDGTVELNVAGAPSTGSYQWYLSESGGTSFNESESWETSMLSSSADYFVSIVNDAGCEGEREVVTANVHPIPEQPVGIAGNNCGPGSVGLRAKSEEAGIFNWYETAYSSISLYQGEAFVTPVLEETTPYWVSITNENGCESDRSEVIAQIDLVPSVPIAEDVSRCAEGGVTLKATGDIESATYSWYETNTSEEVLIEGAEATFDVSSTRDYFVSAKSPEGCEGPRNQVRVTINHLPSKPSLQGGDICGNGNILLTGGGAPLGGTYHWYKDANDTDTLKSGNEFLTPELVNSRSYWVSIVTPEGCEGPREEVIATIHSLPERPIGVDASSCGPGPATLSVSSSVESPVYSWYFEETGGFPFANGNSYTIGYLTETTSYWVSVVTAEGCESSREKVTAEFQEISPVEIGQDTLLCINSGVFDLTRNVPIGGVFTGPGVINGMFYPSIAGVGTHLITYDLINPVGCFADGQRVITVISDQSGGENLDIGEPSYPICLNDGIIDLSIFPNIPGGTWSGSGVTLNSFDPKTTGSGRHTLLYSVDVNGCTAEREKEIIVLEVPEPPNIDQSEVAICLGSEIELNVISPDPSYSYQWKVKGETASFTSGQAIQYSATDNRSLIVIAENTFACTSMPAEVGVEIKEIQADFKVSTKQTKIAERVDFTTDYENASSYLWDFGDGLTSKEKDPSHYYYEEDTFTISLVISTEDCEKRIIKEDLITVLSSEDETILGAEDQPNENIKLYPQPFDHSLTIEFYVLKAGIYQIEVYDLSGVSLLVENKKLIGGEAKIRIDGSELSSGVYLCKVSNIENEQWVKAVKK
ncbi:MAG: T9SS type A sorting domain-containing protein [Cyclobacteriaceae bacterium]